MARLRQARAAAGMVVEALSACALSLEVLSRGCSGVKRGAGVKVEIVKRTPSSGDGAAAAFA